MALTPGFKHDIFVSYAHTDNKAGASGTKWVSQFVTYLGTSIQQRLGCGDDLRIYFDQRDLSGDHLVDDLVREVQQSAIFLAVSSPSYVAREWTRRELDAFTGLQDHEDRLFAVEMLPLDRPEDYPRALHAKPRAHFWHVIEEESRAPLTLDPQLDQRTFVQKLIKLSAQIRDKLIDLRERQPDDSARAPQGAGSSDSPEQSGSRGTVLLAQVTDELEWECEQVRTFLQQMQTRVLPEVDYPQGGEAFRDAFANDLAEADLVVQLVGRAVGRRPPDLPEGYSRCQFDMACASDKQMLMWCHPETDAASVPSEPQRDMLNSPSLVACGLESFKSEILTALDRMRAPRREIPKSVVYVGADRSDLDVAQALADGLKDANFPVGLPTFEGSSEEIRQELEEHICESDSLVFVHGAAPSKWVRTNLRRMHRLMATRDEPPEKVAVYLAPPPDKPDVGLSLPYVEVIDGRDGLEVDTLLKFLETAK
ncbi:MAG: toll/interleukin-1 receptor domain-containing protein [Pseudomonadota bacterium]